MLTLEKTKKAFLVNLLLLITLGVVMVYSASYIYAKETFGSSLHFTLKQISFLALGGILAFFVSKTKMSFWYKNIYFLNGVITFLIFLTHTPLGISIKGSQRWLNIAGFSFQPGELIKYTGCLAAIYYFNKFDLYSTKEKLLNALHFLVPLLLLIVQPDFGSFSIVSIIICFAAFLSNLPRKIFYSGLVLINSGVVLMLFVAPYRVKRLMVFLDPWKDPQNSGFQIIQSYLAFANGHIWGQGIGNSNEKLFYLPEAHNDFILSVLGEELGLVGVIFIVFLFLSFTFLGFKLALCPKSKINQQIIASLIFAISIQAFLNMGVVLGLLPTKGLNLPFVSYGGTAFVCNLIVIGMIFSCLADKSQFLSSEPDEVRRAV